MDVVFINPNSSAKAYQDLALIYSAIEPPTWALLLAQACRSKNFEVSILDCDAERLSLHDSLQSIEELKPRLICFVVYGQNPNSGTTSMIGATALGEYIRGHAPEYPICFVGSHTSALPKDVLRYPFVDFVLLNEGVYALQNLLRTNLKDELHKVKGIGRKEGGQLILNKPEQIVPQDTSAEVLAFRDAAWQTYFTNPAYLKLVEKKFGGQERRNVEDMASIKLKRKLLGD